MTIDKAAEYFLTSLEIDQLSKHTIKAYTQDLRQFISVIKKDELNELDFQDFESYFSLFKNLKVTSLKRKRIVVHRFLKFCYRKKFCQEKLYEYIDPIRSKKDTAPKEVLKPKEIETIFDSIKSEQDQYEMRLDSTYYAYLYYCSVRNELLISILLYTGCRANEVVSLKKESIDLEQNTITLYTKGAKYNKVPIHHLLNLKFTIYNDNIKKLPTEIKSHLDNTEFLFPSKDDIYKAMSTRTLHDIMKRLSALLNRHIHAHIFRHTFASYCIASNMDISTISSLISHSNPSITLSIYTHEISTNNKQEQIKKLNFN